MSADPPRRPPPHQLFRSKSYQGPVRRKRGREVLEDITWIVNDPSSWRHQVDGVTGLGIEAVNEARADGRQEVQHSEQDGVDGQQPAASTSRAVFHPATSARLNLAGINNTAAPHPFANTLQAAPLPRLTAQDPLSSSPPISPRLSGSSFHLGVPSGSGSGSSTSRSLSPSPSLRAPPLSRRGSSSSLNGNSSSNGEAGPSSFLSLGGTAMRRVRTHTGIRSTPVSPNLEQHGAAQSQEQAVFPGPSFVRRVNAPTNMSTLPSIAQSPERKRTRRHDGSLEQEEEDESDDEP